jgi:hypothetical protein
MRSDTAGLVALVTEHEERPATAIYCAGPARRDCFYRLSCTQSGSPPACPSGQLLGTSADMPIPISAGMQKSQTTS